MREFRTGATRNDDTSAEGARVLPTEPDARKQLPIARGVLDYFPQAIAEVASVSRVGNDQHNPGQPMHWAREKSTDHADCIARHLIERGTLDTDGLRHTAKLAWRALALLQEELESRVCQSDKDAYAAGQRDGGDGPAPGKTFEEWRVWNGLPCPLPCQPCERDYNAYLTRERGAHS